LKLIAISTIVVLCFVIVLISILFFSLLKKVRSSSKDNFNLIQFPKETEQKIDNFIEETRSYNNELKNFLKKEHNDAKKIISEVDEKIAPFEKVAREKSDELKEYKKGYEYSRNKALLDGIIDTIEFIENAENKIRTNDETTKSYFSSTKDKLIIILNNSGIERFKPELNTSSLENHGCEVSPSTEITNDTNKINLIHSVLKDGYKLILKGKEIQYVRKALVKVYAVNDEKINAKIK